MHPLRIIILVVLFYFLFRLLTGGGRKKRHHAGGSYGQEGPGGGQPVRDVLVEDQVCRKYIPRTQAIQLQHDHQIHYFCSQKCCDKFLTEKGAG